MPTIQLIMQLITPPTTMATPHKMASSGCARLGWRGVQLLLAGTLLTLGCEYFDNGEQGALSSTSGATTQGDETTTPSPSPGPATSGTDGDGSSSSSSREPIPPEGFRVFPMYLLQDVPAVVTVSDGELESVACVAEGLDAGYVCNTAGWVQSTATIRIEHDGFEPAVRQPNLVPDVLEDLEIHMSIEGGSTALWSTCTAVDLFTTCEELCGNDTLECAVVSCTTADEQWPLATYQTFPDQDCIVEGSLGAAATCDEPLPELSEETAYIRCCCDS